MEPMYTTEEVAQWLRVDVVTVRRIIARGELGAYRIGNEFRCSMRDINDFLERRHIDPRADEDLEPLKADDIDDLETALGSDEAR